MEKKPRQLRVRAFGRNDFSGFQLLQEKRWWGWKTIDREEVPSHVGISRAFLGDTGGWVSKFNAYGTFGRDGIVKRTETDGAALKGTLDEP